LILTVLALVRLINKPAFDLVKQAEKIQRKKKEKKMNIKKEAYASNDNPKQPKNFVNLIKVMDQIKKKETDLDLVHLGDDETAMIIYDSNCMEVFVHYCPEIGGNNYVLCNGPDCLLCSLGQTLKQQLLLPVYLPKKYCISFLPFDPNCTSSHYFFEIIVDALETEKDTMIFVTWNEDEEIYEGSIMVDEENMRDIYEATEFYYSKLLTTKGMSGNGDIYPKISNEKLAHIERIGRLMALKKEDQFSGM
jgi:hypothetical protein